MIEMTNEDRADRGIAAMIAWAGNDYSAQQMQSYPIEDWGDMGQEVLQDLLNDLHHVAEMAQLDIDQAFYSGHRSYLEEVAEANNAD